MGRVVDTCPKAKQGVRAFIDRVGGGGRLYAEKAQASLTVIFTFVISGLSSSILIVLDAVNLQLQGFASSSYKCGTSCPGYSIVIM